MLNNENITILMLYIILKDPNIQVYHMILQYNSTCNNFRLEFSLFLIKHQLHGDTPLKLERPWRPTYT